MQFVYVHKKYACIVDPWEDVEEQEVVNVRCRKEKLLRTV